MTQAELIDDFLAAVLRDETPCWPEEFPTQDTDSAIWQRIDFHGIAVALHARRSQLGDWPAALLERIKSEAYTRSFWEDSHRRILLKLIDELDAAKVKALFLKGTALAYSFYDLPAMRRRGDSDMLVEERNLQDARKALARCGFTCSNGPHGVFYQEVWRFNAGAGFHHIIDLHWQVLDAPSLHRFFPVKEFFERSVPLPRLHERAWASDPVLSFIHGSINQAWHGQHGYRVLDERVSGKNRLIWVWDNHLLAESFTDQQWQDLATLCLKKDTTPLCLAALELARKNFLTPLPARVIERMQAAPQDTSVTRYLLHSSQFSQIFSNWKTTPGFVGKLRYSKGLVFPPAYQMREKFPEADHWPVALLHVRRLLTVAARWLGFGKRPRD